jgi:hypothetical protein
MTNPTQIGVGANIRWTVPAEVMYSDTYMTVYRPITQVTVYRSTTENANYALCPTQPAPCTPGAGITTAFSDPTGEPNKYYYLVTFNDAGTAYSSPYHIAFYDPLPSELRLIQYVRSTMPDIINKSCIPGAANVSGFNAPLTDNDYLTGLNLAVQMFNVYPPETNFSLAGFPRSHEFFLIGLAQMTTIASRFLPVSIRDWSYSEPGGVVMQVDRGAKMNAAIQVIANVYTQYLPLVKLDFGSDMPLGFGTIQLPMSMGGVMNRGMLNVLDIFTAGGR